MELITVIVPIYNVSQYLDRCVNSIVNQTYKNLEIILVDDGSRDDSSKKCDEYAIKYKNIVVIHKKNEGLGFARNSGLSIAKGSYIVFVDGDDYIESTMIEHLYKDMILHNADTCIGGFKRVYKDKIVENKNPFAGQEYENDEILKNVLVKMFGKKQDLTDFIKMSVWKVLFSSKIINENNLKFPSERVFISEDIIFDTDYYVHSNKVYISDNIGYCYCDNEGSLTTKYRFNRFELQKKLYVELVRRTKNLGIYSESQQRLITSFVSVTRYCIKLEQKFCIKNGIVKSLKNIKYICNDFILQDAFKIYNQEKVPSKSKIINNLIIKKRIIILFVIMWIKNAFNI